MYKWYYAKDNQQCGPVNTEDLRKLYHSGEITANTLVWRQGMTQWARYCDVPELHVLQQQIYPSTPTPTTQSSATPSTNTFGLVGFILGIVSLLLCCCGLTAIPGLVLSIIAQVQISQEPTRYRDSWMAITGIVLNALVLIANLISTIFFFAAGKGLQEVLRQLQSSNIPL